MFLVDIGRLLNNVAADCWKVPDSLGVENTGDETNLGRKMIFTFIISHFLLRVPH